MDTKQYIVVHSYKFAEAAGSMLVYYLNDYDKKNNDIIDLYLFTACQQNKIGAENTYSDDEVFGQIREEAKKRYKAISKGAQFQKFSDCDDVLKKGQEKID